MMVRSFRTSPEMCPPLRPMSSGLPISLTSPSLRHLVEWLDPLQLAFNAFRHADGTINIKMSREEFQALVDECMCERGERPPVIRGNPRRS